MKSYKLVIDGRRSRTSLFISATCDADAWDKAAEIARSFGPDLSLHLLRGDEPVSRMARAVGALAAALDPTQRDRTAPV